ncbi:MAG: hypothetical protein JO055_02565, partial [Alphaproteobacteria bacterium]|nr:hypothetical protein [Alphaproteobacteria bacterium]
MAAAGKPTGTLSEEAFAGLVDALAADPDGSARLIDLLHEAHPVYDGRGMAAIVRMRGWILLALARPVLSDQALIFVLEELDAGGDAYLVAAAARALRSHAQPNETFAPFVARALARIRAHDEPVSFEHYGEYALSATGKTAVSELLATLAWLGPNARAVVPQLERWRAERGLSRTLRLDLDRTLRDIRAPADSVPSCCEPLPDVGQGAVRRERSSLDTLVLQDQDGKSLRFADFFTGR